MVDGPPVCFVFVPDPILLPAFRSQICCSTECDDTFTVSEYFIVCEKSEDRSFIYLIDKLRNSIDIPCKADISTYYLKCGQSQFQALQWIK